MNLVYTRKICVNVRIYFQIAMNTMLNNYYKYIIYINNTISITLPSLHQRLLIDAKIHSIKYYITFQAKTPCCVYQLGKE